MVTMFFTLLSFANESSFFTVKNDAERTSLSLKNVKKGNLLSIFDDNGIILYKETINQNGNYTKGFDLTTLPDGSYSFELDADLEIKTIPFTVASNIVTFNKELELTTFKPLIKVKDNMVFISKFNSNLKPLKIDVYFESSSYSFNSGLMHSETIKDIINVERILKLTGLKKGSYKIVITTEGREFIKYINN